MRYKALCYLDDQQGRDVELILPLVCFAEMHLDCEVEFEFVWNIHAIYKKQPDIVLLPNTVGSQWYFEISQYAHQQGIKVFALISEGNFRTNGTFNYWGYNTDKKYYEEYICHWSERTCNFLKNELPEIADRNVVTGATGFDRYLTDTFTSKEEFLRHKGVGKYKKVIGYAGWAFGKAYTESGRAEIRGNQTQTKEERIQWLKDQRIVVENFLRTLISNNPDTLFILKRHPNETHPHITKESPNEMNGLLDLENVMYIRDDVPIHELIHICDLWTGFETTTTLEAWLLGKQTILFNPEPDFFRDQLYKGSVIAQSPEDAQKLIDEYYQTNTIQSFYTTDLKEKREQLIKDTIGFSDGLNHIRAAYYLTETLKQVNRDHIKPIFKWKYYKRILGLRLGSLFYYKPLFIKLPKFRKTVWIFDRYKLKELKIRKQQKLADLKKFYSKTQLDKKEKQVEFWNKL